MSGYYPLYVGASLSNSSQQVGMGLLRLYDTANGGFGSLAIYDSGIVFRDSANNIISIGGGGGGDMVLASVQTVTGAKTFNDSTLLLANVAGTFSSKFTNTNTAARTYTLPDAAGTIALTSNITGTNSGTNTGDQTITLTGAVTGSGTGSFVASLGSFTKSQLDTAVSDANVMYVGDAPTSHNHDASAITTGTLGVARGGTGLAALGTSLQVLRTNAAGTANEYATLSTGSGDALVANPLSQFAATTSAQLAGVISDETGSDKLVFSTSPTLVTPNIGAATGRTLVLTPAANGFEILRINRSDGSRLGAIGDWGAFSIAGLWLSPNAPTVSNVVVASVGNQTVLNCEQETGSTSLRTAYVERLSVTNTLCTVSLPISINGGTTLQKILSATATLDFPSIASNDTHTLTMTVTGAVAGNAVFIGVPAALDANLIWCGSVTAADTVTIRMHNASGASVDPASGTYRATVFQF